MVNAQGSKGRRHQFPSLGLPRIRHITWKTLATFEYYAQPRVAVDHYRKQTANSHPTRSDSGSLQTIRLHIPSGVGNTNPHRFYLAIDDAFPPEVTFKMEHRHAWGGLPDTGVAEEHQTDACVYWTRQIYDDEWEKRELAKERAQV
jgi:hypothetical protein